MNANPIRKIILAIAIAGLVMLGVFRFADWYANTSALPRYCKNPAETLRLVNKILTEDMPAQSENRRPYIVAAKLVFLVPQSDGEDIPAYLDRLHSEITMRCGSVF